MTEAQSDVAVQPTWILACAKADPVSATLSAKVATSFFTAISPFTFLRLDYRYFLGSYMPFKGKGRPT
jgi:hypothetical protein